MSLTPLCLQCLNCTQCACALATPEYYVLAEAIFVSLYFKNIYFVNDLKALDACGIKNQKRTWRNQKCIQYMIIRVKKYTIVLIIKWFYNNYKGWFSTRYCSGVSVPHAPASLLSRLHWVKLRWFYCSCCQCQTTVLLPPKKKKNSITICHRAQQ